MNRGELINMVKKRAWSTSVDQTGIDELISLYPWFQSAYTLKLDACYSSDSIAFDEELKRYAVYIANREVLYYVLKETDNRSAGENSAQKESKAENRNSRIFKSGTAGKTDQSGFPW